MWKYWASGDANKMELFGDKDSDDKHADFKGVAFCWWLAGATFP
jgi:hypothetical protein